MREEFTRNGAGDFSRRYQGTYGYFLSGEGKKVMVQVDQVGEEQVHFTDKNKNPYTANADRGNVFEFIPVERGLYDCAADMIYVDRRPARQWKRGICNENTYLYSFSSGDNVSVVFNRLEAVFGGDKSNNLQDWLNKKRTGVAFNRQFGVWNGLLYLYNRVIGKIVKDVFKVDPIFVQEMKDIVRDLELKFKVEANDVEQA